MPSVPGERARNSRPTPSAREMKRRFPDAILTALGKVKGLRIRIGNNQHRFIGIWFVMLKDRVFVRSWSVKPNGWYRTFLKQHVGSIQVAGRELPVRAMRAQNKRLRDRIDRAYLEKYNTPGALKYAKDLGLPKSRATTIELVPT